MRRVSKKSWTPWWIAALLVASLVLLATFQYRWLGEVSAAERQRLSAVLERGARGFSEDFDRELTRVYVYFQPVTISRMDLLGSLAEAERRYRAEAPCPELLEEVLVLHGAPSEEAELQRFDPAAAKLADLAWPPELVGLGRRLGELRPRPPEALLEHLLADDVPALVLPLFSGPWRARMSETGRRDASFGRRSRERTPRERGRGLGGWLILRLDAAAVTERFLPQLAERHFAGEGGELAYHVEVVSRQAPERRIFAAGPPLASGSADVRSPLFAFLGDEEMRQLIAEAAPPARQEPPHPPGARFAQRWYPMALAAHNANAPRWSLRVTHPAGSLEAALGAAHRRNLATSGAILAVLAGALALVLGATRRAQALARQQLEFVAGVTHELMTPLAAMRSAGQNLADGVVTDPEQVARYGALVEREGRRLTDMVGQVLEYAGIQSGRQTYSLQEIDVSEVVGEVLVENQRLLAEESFDVETSLAQGLPSVLADREALRRAVTNLILNAVKYAAEGAWLGVSSTAERGGVALRVADRGPGIAQADLPHLFEPFYRGRELAAGNVPGSGLGLALVRHVSDVHGGRVSAENRAEGGSVFTLLLPAARQEGGA